ncbi:MAG: hypothetical protein Q8P31_13410, partial [Bacillota bacterium]|nr:hypothetical protein [Bacillota bacterium]
MKIPQVAKDKLMPWFTSWELDQARISIVPCLPPNVWAMTFGNRILIRRDKWNLEIEGVARIGHELVHSRAYRQMGPVPFLARYCWDAVRLWRRPWNTWPLEAPAYKVQHEIETSLELKQREAMSLRLKDA